MKSGTCGLTTLKRWEPPSVSDTYDNGFAALVSAHVKETVEACLDDPGVFLTSHLLMMKSLTSAPS